MPADVMSLQAWELHDTTATHLQVNVWISGYVAEVGFQDLLSASDVWVGHGHMAVKAPWPDQRLIQRLWEVGRRYDNHPLTGLEPAGNGSSLRALTAICCNMVAVVVGYQKKTACEAEDRGFGNLTQNPSPFAPHIQPALGPGYHGQSPCKRAAPARTRRARQAAG